MDEWMNGKSKWSKIDLVEFPYRYIHVLTTVHGSSPAYPIHICIMMHVQIGSSTEGQNFFD